MISQINQGQQNKKMLHFNKTNIKIDQKINLYLQFKTLEKKNLKII